MKSTSAIDLGISQETLDLWHFLLANRMLHDSTHLLWLYYADPLRVKAILRAFPVAKLLEGKSLEEACRFGSKIASLSVAYRGGQTYRI